ncbi:MAG: DNA translocase FtsK 4TM domain-containing protein, partial [Muribaculaceae bacterium]|nr:DNA translocase FtsK 4TM domain-containing protein [Muribaculaceae bacterium]
VGDIVASGQSVANRGGALGARLSQSIFSQGLGLGAVVVIVYLVLLGLGLMGIRKVSFWSLTFKSLLVGIATSLVAGLVALWTDADVNFGGDHGLYINQLIISYADWAGAALVACVLVAAVVYVYLNDIAALVARYRAVRRARRDRDEQSALEREEACRKVREAMATSDIAGNDHAEAGQSSDEARDSAAHGTRLDALGFAETDDASDSDPYDVSVAAASRQGQGESDMEFGGSAADDNSQTEADDAGETGFGDEAGKDVGKDVGDNPTAPAPGPTHVTEVVAGEPGFEVKTAAIEEAREDNSQLYDPTAELSHYERPPLDLLRPAAGKTHSVDLEEQEENKERITKTLNDYGIPISHIEATVGPTVTLYEIIPAEGVRIAKIKRLEDDIAMSLAALGIRIIAPIPGKGTIGIEVPNKDPQTVSIRSVLGSKAYQDCRMKLPMAMGATISNEVYIADLAKMPHLLVAGATGMGKSVGLNTIIASLLYKKHPAELKFVLVDPKMVEFSLYSVLERHFLAKLPDEDDAVATDMDKVVRTLNSLCVEMDQRYMLLR